MESKKINQLATNVAPLSSDLTIIGDPTTGVSKKVTLLQIANLFAGAVDFYANLAAFPATGVINTIYCAKDTKKLYLWSGSTYVETFPSQALLDTYQLRSEKGVSNGYASLDSGGKVPISQLPSSIMEYKGMWSATTNTPTLANGTGDTGDVYICNGAGSVNFGAGAITFAVGDYVVYSGTIWQRSSGAVGTVTSVGLSSATSGVTIGSSPITTSGTITLAIANATTSQNGLLTSTDWATFNSKEPAITSGTSLQYYRGDKTFQTLNTSIVPELTNLYYTDVRARTSLSFVAGSGAYNSTTGVITIPTNNTQITNGANYITLASLSATSPIFYNSTTGVISSQAATTALNGYLTSTDWTTFNGKIGGSGTTNYLPKFTGASTLGNSSISDGVISGEVNIGANLTTTGASRVQNGFYVGYANAGALASYTLIYGATNGIQIALANNTGGASFIFQTANSYSYTFPAATGTIALVGGSGVGTVTSVAALTLGTTGTDLSSTVANGTTTPVITLNVPTASATNRGALSSADWTTFNNKQAALTNPVTGTGTQNYHTKWNNAGGTTIGNSLIWDNGTNVGIGNTNTSYTLDVSGTGRFTSTLLVSGASTFGDSVTITAGNSYANYAFKVNNAAGAEKLRLDGNGNLLVGYTTDQGYKFGVNGTSIFASAALFQSNVSVNGSAIATSGILTVKTDTSSIGATTALGLLISNDGGIGKMAQIGFGYSESKSGAVIGGIITNGGGSTSSALFFATRDTTDGTTAPTERMRITSGGGVGIGTTTVTGTTKLRVINSSASNGDALMFVDNAVYNGIGIYSAGADGYNGAATVMIIGRNSSTTRSINAGGTINASGADYAEYMTKTIEDNIAKGDIVGVDKNGLLTNIFEDAKSFVVKSTDPSYVGGDTWGNIDDIGKLPLDATDEQKAEHEAKIESARAKVDRIAFSGQVPCNVLGANVGDYIIPINDNGTIKGQAVTNPSFEQYQISVGKVWKIMEDGRAWIAVKIG